MPTYGTIRDSDSHYTSYLIKPQPCGHGGQPPCAIPLDDFLPLLIFAALILGIKKLKI